MKILKRYIMAAAAIDQAYYDAANTGIAYKVFKVKNGKLYPPMVANQGGVDTPVGVWLEAEEGEFAGLNSEGRPMVKSIGSGSLAYRPGWHLGDEPRAPQFDRDLSWVIVDELPDNAVLADKSATSESTIPRSLTGKNIGKYVYIKSTGQYAYVYGEIKNPQFFPYNFVWAKCQYVMNINYQEEAHQAGVGTRQVNYKLLPDIAVDDNGNEYHILQFKQGNNLFIVTFDDLFDIRIDGYPFVDLEQKFDSKDYVQKEVQNYFLQDNMDIIESIISSGSNRGKETMRVFSHRYGDIKHLPTGGFYKYRTNPKPDTVPWVITGAIKVLELLGDDEVNDILVQNGVAPIHRQGGDLTVGEILHNN